MSARASAGTLSALLVALVLALTALPLSAPALLGEAPEPGAPGPYVGPSDDAIPPGAYAWSTPAAAVGEDFKQCGRFKLVFRNPDLQQDPTDHKVKAQGTFFVQFQVVGPGSSDVKRLSFSFGVTTNELNENPLLNCNTSIPPNPVGQGTAGAYLLYYRNDYDPTDGFFVPILTGNVPDGEYAAAIHAYTGNCNNNYPNVAPDCIEVARAWTRAIVDNCTGISLVSQTCPQDNDASVTAHDHTMPWPIVLPGDGKQTNGVNGLTIEWGERMINDTVKAWLNDAPLKLDAWTPQPRDTDLQPNNDNQDCHVGPLDGIRALCERAIYGDSHKKWLGEVKDGDILIVEGRDQNRNFVNKTIHVGAATSGGTVDLQKPDLDINVLNGGSVAIKPGDLHEFNIRLTNLGNDPAHTDLRLQYEQGEGLAAEWTDLTGSAQTHIAIEPGTAVHLKVKVKADADAKTKTHEAQAVAAYDVAGSGVEKKLPLTVRVDPKAGTEHHASHTEGFDTPTEGLTPDDGAVKSVAKKEGKSPGVGMGIVVLFLVGMVFVERMRQRF